MEVASFMHASQTSRERAGAGAVEVKPAPTLGGFRVPKAEDEGSALPRSDGAQPAMACTVRTTTPLLSLATQAARRTSCPVVPRGSAERSPRRVASEGGADHSPERRSYAQRLSVSRGVVWRYRAQNLVTWSNGMDPTVRRILASVDSPDGRDARSGDRLPDSRLVPPEWDRQRIPPWARIRVIVCRVRNGFPWIRNGF